MNHQLEIVTSLYVPEQALELPAQIRTAFEAHAVSGLVGEIHVLTEANISTVRKLLGSLVNGQKFKVVSSKLRPTFATLFSHATERVTEGISVAVMNADVSFRSDEDIQRCFAAIGALSRGAVVPVLALTRHDPFDDGWKIGLYQACGLPNMLSVDCWIISAPVLLELADLYSLGEMNCDLMANHDLISAGYQVFNPCLDVCIQHHEKDSKTNEYYVEYSKRTDSLERLSRFMNSRNCPSYRYFELPRVRTDWLILGYNPAPYSNQAKKLFIRLPAMSCEEWLCKLVEVENFSIRNSFDLILLGEGPLDSLFKSCAPMLLRNNRIYLLSLGNQFDDFISSLMADGYDGRACVVFASSLRFLSDDLAKTSDFIVLQDKIFSDSPRMADPGIRRSSTLITSVYKSDEFLENFAINSLSLENYHEAVDHIFLISETSPEERRVLIKHFGSCDNVLIVRNSSDPGLYPCWNLGISLATTDYVSNANVDDLRASSHVSELTGILDRKSHVGVACSAIVPFHDGTMDIATLASSPSWYADEGGEFGYFDLGDIVEDEGGRARLKPHNLPHCMPVWRKSLHTDHGFFDESRYGTFADWAFWLTAAKNGNRGFLHPESLSFYYVNPNSHNRRGRMLDEFHRRIEEENLPLFVKCQSRLKSSRRSASFRGAGPGTRPTEKKLNLGFTELYYGNHRNSFGTLVESLRPLHLGEGGIRFLPFLERYFHWGSSGHEARSKDPRPITTPWVGIIHVPFDSPEWFAGTQRPEVIFETDLWIDSLPNCRGLICLSEDLQADLNVCYPDLPTLAVKHPTGLKVMRFEFRKYVRKPRVVQAGDWLRQLQAIYRLKASGHKKLMLRKRTSIKSLELEIKEMGNFIDESVSVKDFVSNEEYDEILSSSVVLCLLYAAAANNLVLECIARHTPIIINPLPSVVEYLGEEYPLYASTVEMADFLLSDQKLIQAASHYLRERVNAVDLTYRGFRRSITNSSFYERL